MISADSCFGASIQSVNQHLTDSGHTAHFKTLLKSLYAVNRQQYIDRLPACLRSQCDYSLQGKIVAKHISADGSVKWLIRFSDGIVETVLIPERGRNTLCVSSQFGCALGCTFCATGAMGYSGNLTCRQILEQVILANNTLSPQRVTNVVFMGMGEPLLNSKAVLDACAVLCNDNAFGLSQQRITISTVGVVPQIRRLAGKSKVCLALSLHAPNDELRRQIIPLARTYTIAQTLSAVQEYLSSLGKKRHVFIEYTMIDGVNDSEKHAQQLSNILNLPAKINLIPCNRLATGGYAPSQDVNVQRFARILHMAGYRVTVRRTRGDDVQAACGQLALNGGVCA